MTFLLSTGIVFYAIVSVAFAGILLNPVCQHMAYRLDRIAVRSGTLMLVAIVFGIPVMFIVLTVVWPVLLYRQIRKELADAD
ncbi:hypothetical protein [Mycobacteroides abscessus]|uniref:hypothetical protein n=1 Tax=Mycobacteroides abscessus TaxID=36809 RepID=UPI0002FF1A64|nr:hypothetical protein [Mycobacteroides abscessus]MDB2215352.1 hypothetical protein [Mycobacteroides abscessus subsp. massiliense]WJJ56461.1 hypothetical protein PROPHIT493_3 [Mycobacterium phage prophiT49-3]